MLRGPSGTLRLAPSYDHGSTLGFNLTDTRLKEFLRDPEALATWLGRGRAEKFEDGRQTSLVDFAHQALSMTPSATWDYWRDRFGSITEGDWVRIVEATPEMSDPARTFVDRMLHVNLRRLLDAGD